MSVQTPNMNLTQPTIGVDSGLTWETAANGNATVVDNHNHTSGNGTPIPPGGLNINAPLPFQGNPATGLQSTVYVSQTTYSTLRALYTKGNELYYNDGAGNVVPITLGGSVISSSSGISSGSASAAFVSSVLVVNSGTNTPANIQTGSILIGNNVAGSNFVTLNAPASLGASYSLTLPTKPSTTQFVTIDSSGNLGTATGISGNQLGTNALTRAQLPAVGQQVSTGSGNVSFGSPNVGVASQTICSVAITTTGNPVVIGVKSDSSSANPTGLASFMNVQLGSPSGANRMFMTVGPSAIDLNSVALTNVNFNMNPLFSVIDTPSAGTQTYTLTLSALANANCTVNIGYVQLYAYELA